MSRASNFRRQKENNEKWQDFTSLSSDESLRGLGTRDSRREAFLGFHNPELGT